MKSSILCCGVVPCSVTVIVNSKFTSNFKIIVRIKSKGLSPTDEKSKGLSPTDTDDPPAWSHEELTSLKESFNRSESTGGAVDAPTGKKQRRALAHQDKSRCRPSLAAGTEEGAGLANPRPTPTRA